jgi:hypothetical protein
MWQVLKDLSEIAPALALIVAVLALIATAVIASWQLKLGRDNQRETTAREFVNGPMFRRRSCVSNEIQSPAFLPCELLEIAQFPNRTCHAPLAGGLVA